MNKMIEMKVRGILGSPFAVSLFLGEMTEETRKTITMGIDSITAQSIDVILRGENTSRPLTHELMEKTLKALNARVDRLEITEIRDGVFIGILVIVNNLDIESHLDSRPSDGIAMALRFGAKILVAKEVFDKCGELLPKEIDDLLSESYKLKSNIDH